MVQVSDRRCTLDYVLALSVRLRILIVEVRSVFGAEMLVECDIMVPWILLNIMRLSVWCRDCVYQR